jgi:uncharacterized protein (TIRG00374 family)
MDTKGKYLQYALTAVIIIGLIWAVVKYVDGVEVWAALEAFQYRFLPFILALSILFFLLKAWRFVVLMNPFAEDLPKLVVFKAYLSGQAATLVPGGVASRVGLMKQANVPVSESSVPVLVHSGWDQAVFLLCALIAALWLPEARQPVMIILGVLGVIALLLIVSPTRLWLAKLAEGIAQRFNREDQWQHFLDAFPQVFTRRIMMASLLITLATTVILIAILALTLQGFELSVSFPALFLAVILPTMLGRLIPVPAGIGVTEASMVSFLTTLGGLDTNTTVAAVAVFRIVTIVFPALLGTLVYFFWWRGKEELDNTDSQETPSVKARYAGPSDL